LIDNSVDGYTRRKINERRKIKIDISPEKFMIFDNCGGIDLDLLKSQVFRFGIEDFAQLNLDSPTLGVYGIGLKRSIFKIGKFFKLETDDGCNHTSVILDINDWKKSKKWELEGKSQTSLLKKNEKPYTKIIMENLNDDVKELFALPSFLNDLINSISKMYTFFIENKIDIYLNEGKIQYYPVSVTSSEMFKPTVFKDVYEDVNINIICFLQPGKGRTKPDRKGWNVFCNDRLILLDDTTPLTGWSGEAGQLPKFHNLYNEFRGIVRLDSNNPVNLPLNTTKTGLTIEHRVYQHTLKKMVKLAKPFISYLNKKYPNELTELEEIENLSKSEIDIEKGKIETIPINELKEITTFSPPEETRPKEKFVNIQYNKPKKIVDKVKKHLSVKSAKEAGIKTFDYYVETEEIENESEET